jgi:hypothetical protein
LSTGPATSTRKYVAVYSLFYVAAIAAMNMLYTGLNIDPGPASNISVVLVAGYVAVFMFVRDVRRAPTIREKRLLIVGCLLSSSLISLLLVVFVAPLIIDPNLLAELAEIIQTLPVILLFAIPVFVLLVYYLVLNLVFGWSARGIAALMLKE